MAKKEEDPFGDFTFSSFSTPNLAPISTKKPQQAEEQEDEEWGDFVKTPFGSTDETNSLSHHHKPPDPPSSGSGSNLKGPLPLSFFGDIEDDVADGSGDKGGESEDLGVEGLNLSKKSGISGGMSDLYGCNGNGIGDDGGDKSNGSGGKGKEDGFSFGFDQKGSSFEGKDSIFESGGFGFGLGLGGDGVKKSGENGDWKGGVSRSVSNVDGNVVSGFEFGGLEDSQPNSAPGRGGQGKEGKDGKESFFMSSGFGFGGDGEKKSEGRNGSVNSSMSNVDANDVSGFDFSGFVHSQPNSGLRMGDQSKEGNVGKDSFFESGGFGFGSGLDGVQKCGEKGDLKGSNGDAVSGSVYRSRLNVENAVSGFNFSGWGLEYSEPNSAPSVAAESKGKNGKEISGSVNRSGLNVDGNADWGFNSSGDQKAKNSNEVNGSVIRSFSNVENAVSGFDFSGWGLESSEPNSAPSVADKSKQGNVMNDEFSFDSNRLVSGSKASTSNTSDFGFDFGGWGLSSNGGGTGSGMLKSSAGVNALMDDEEIRSNSKHTELDGNGQGGDNSDEDDDDGWEFKGAFSDNKADHGVDVTLNSGYNSNGGSPNKVASLTSKTKELDGIDNNGINYDENKPKGFPGIFLEENAGHTVDKVGSSTREPSNTSTYSTGLSNGSYNADNLFAISDGLNNMISVGNGVSIDSSNLAQKSNSLAAPINFTPESFLRSEPSEGKAQLSSSDIITEDAETDDDFGDFTAAFSQAGATKETDSKVNDVWASATDAGTSTSLDQVNNGQHFEQSSRSEAHTPSPVIGSSHGAHDLFSMSNGSTDLFSMANAADGSSVKLQTNYDTLSSNAAEISGVAPTHQGIAQDGDRDELNPHPVNVSDENEDDFGDFADAFGEAGQEVLKAGMPSQSDQKESEALGKDLGTGSAAGNKKGALPLSLFGDEESEAETNILNTDTHSRSVSQSSGPSPKSAVSINDLISNLYSQAEQSSPQKFIGATDSGASPTIEIKSESVHPVEDSNDDSWEFKGSFGNEGTSTETSHEVTASSIPSKARVKDYVEFYSKLQDILYFLIKCHLENIKKDGDSGNVMTVDEGIQDELKEHAQKALVTGEDGFEGQATTDASLHELIEALKHPTLQILEAEYDLSIKLSSAEKDFKSALELKRHAKAMIYLLSLGSLEDHLMYVSLWSKMISTCAEELQAGGKILEQSLKRNIKNELLSEIQVKEFIKALGEIYRVAMVLGVSARLYKPWTLGCSAESTKMFSFLDECQSVWSASGLEKALLDILHMESYNEDDALPALVESIQYIHNLDVNALIDHVFNRQDSRCGLSLLTLDVIPGMKTVVWDGNTYFVKLANLWANMISCDPPRVPPLHEMVDVKDG